MKSMTVALLIAAAVCLPAGAQSQAGGASIPLRAPFRLAGSRTNEVQYFRMESRLAAHAPDGSITSTDIYRLFLKATPAKIAGADRDVYTCLEFTLQLGTAPEVKIPSLAGFTYLFTSHPMEKDPGGRTLGIPHEPFEALKDQAGKSIPVANAYHVYNAFIDFHSFFIFTDRTPEAGGIQDLTRLGQKVVHPASFSQPSTSLGSQVNEGSYFKNGEVTIELKGVGLVDDAACAIVGYDSGASSFRMLVTPVPNLEVKTTGSSHYWGDVYKDLETGWVRKAVLTELVVSETVIPGQTSTVKGVIEQSISVRNVTKKKP
jgi:hypothetical protein